MRTEKEMMELILKVAEEDERIRAVYMNGSRTNKNAKKDLFQDYDIVYAVRETASFIDDPGWIDCFGERLVMQMPEEMDRARGMKDVSEECYGYLIQLADGNRLDLHINTLEYSIRDIQEDQLCLVLLDKDQALPSIAPANDRQRWVEKPSRQDFECCLNEFWWLLNNIGKGLWRKEILYVMDMIQFYLRPELLRLLIWEAGESTDFTVSVGKSAKYIEKYLEAEEYEQYLKSYPQAQTEKIWAAVEEMCNQFSRISKRLGERFGFAVDQKQEHSSRLFLACTKCLPEDADQFLFVREGTAEDYMELARLWLNANLQAHSFIPANYWQEHYDSVLAAFSMAELLVYEDGNGVRGFAGLQRKQDKAYLEGLFVNEGDRSKGVGRSLMSVCKARCRELELRVYEKNRKAVCFYEQQGFCRSELSVNKETGEKEWVMVWRKQ